MDSCCRFAVSRSTRVVVLGRRNNKDTVEKVQDTFDTEVIEGHSFGLGRDHSRTLRVTYHIR